MAFLEAFLRYGRAKEQNEKATILSFALFTGWIISLPYEGPVLYALTSAASTPVNTALNKYNLLLLATGLLTGGLLPLPEAKAKNTILALMLFALGTSIAIALFPVVFWIFMLPPLSFIAGTGMGLYGYLVKAHVPRKRWSLVAPDVMILACLVVIGAHILVNFLSAWLAFIFAEMALAMAITSLARVDPSTAYGYRSRAEIVKNPARTFAILYLFIFIVTINAGIMFHVIYPAFAAYERLASIYLNLPYVASIAFFSHFYKGNKFNVLFIGLSLWGVALIIFDYLPLTPVSFMVLASCMMFASGIFDLFWWTIFTTSFGYVKKPSLMFGTILSVNVFGSLAGGQISAGLTEAGHSAIAISHLGLATLMLCMVLIVPLNKRLSPYLRNDTFLEKQHWNRIEDTQKEVVQKLSSRELEVYRLLLTNSSDKDIAAALHISINTVKSHNRKIYQKLEIKNRIELRKHFSNQPSQS